MTSIDDALVHIDGARGEIGTYAEMLADRASAAEAKLAAIDAILDRHDRYPANPAVETVAERLERILRTGGRAT